MQGSKILFAATGPCAPVSTRAEEAVYRESSQDPMAHSQTGTVFLLTYRDGLKRPAIVSKLRKIIFYTFFGGWLLLETEHRISHILHKHFTPKLSQAPF